LPADIGLLFDAFFVYRRGLLDRSAFIEWLRWRNHEYTGTEPNFKIGPYPTKMYRAKPKLNRTSEFRHLLYRPLSESAVAPGSVGSPGLTLLFRLLKVRILNGILKQDCAVH
jgi:hypothetical protein